MERPQFEAALALAREIKAHAPHCRVILAVNAMKRLGRGAAAEHTALADHLSAHGLVLEMLAGPLPGLYDPAGAGSTGELIVDGTREGLAATANRGVVVLASRAALGQQYV